MREIVKGLMSVLIHFAIGLACCLLYVWFFKTPDVLPQFVLKWRLTETGLLFIRIMPNLLVAAILIGYAVIFGTCGQNTVPRYSEILLKYLKEVFIILFFCITVYTLLVEMITPLLFGYRNYTKLKTNDYYDFIKDADVALKNGQTERAQDKIKAALGIWRDNPEALALSDSIKVSHELHSKKQKNDTETEPAYFNATDKNLTAEDALRTGEHYMNNRDFYSAHYYAMRSYNLSSEHAPYREEALRLAAQAWNQIEKGSAELTADFDIRLYQAKKAGYEMMQQGDYIKAHYHFIDTRDMLEEHDPLKRDPDLDRFIEITGKKLLEEIFFIDEIASLPAFESARNISFIIPDSKAEAAARITIEGLSFVTENGVQTIYGRNGEITQYAAGNRIAYRYKIPFIKIIPISGEGGNPAMRMLFRASDKQHGRMFFQPIVLEGTMPVERQSSKLLPFSSKSFELIIAANRGEKMMTLPQLYTFKKESAQYGFPAQIFHREILARIGNAFLILIISVHALILAWSFRIPPHEQFRKTWALSFPVFFAAITGFVEAVRYCNRLLITLFTDIVYPFSTVLLLFVYTLLFVEGSFLFFAQRSESY